MLCALGLLTRIARGENWNSLPVTPNPVEISPGVLMPRVNLGTCCGSDPSVDLPGWISAGGRGIDTAWDYHDQPAIAAALANISVSRSDLFITTKIPGTNAICRNTSAANILGYIQQDLAQLNTSYLDLVLLHHPCSTEGANVEVWKAMELALHRNMTRSIGVSNFKRADLEALASAHTTVKPSVNQCNMPPGKLLDPDGFDYCQQHGITYESYNAIKGCQFSNPELKQIGARHNVSVAQVCLRWVLQMGAVIAVGTGKNATTADAYAKQNLDLYGFNLTDSEMQTISQVTPPNHISPLNMDLLAALFAVAVVVIIVLVFVPCRRRQRSMYSRV